MDLGTALAERVFGPFYQKRWGLYDAELDHRLAQSQFLSPDEVLDLQLGRFRDVLRHAKATTSLYRERFADIDPERLTSPEDIEQLPILTKDDLRTRAEELISDSYRRPDLFHKRTGGSTGVPVHVWWDHESRKFKRALVERHDAWAGYRLGRRKAALWGDVDGDQPLKERIYRRICERTIYLDTLKMTEENLESFAHRIREFRPPVLMGHAHSIHFFTRYIVDAGFDDVTFDGIISTAEALLPSERAEIEARFGNVVFDRYGCEEVSLIASECESHDGLHIGGEGIYVETVGENAEAPGAVVVTDLVSRGMPILRYEVGDLATTLCGPCSCGRGLPRLGRVFGRTSDVLYAPDGRQISGISILDTFVIHVAGLKQAQIVQDRLDHLRIRVVRDHGFDESSKNQLASAVSHAFGPEMQHTLEYVEVIEPTPRGKFQFTICEIEPPSGSPE
jgi:phenylacetate-CoA ligase